jgi:hypothetical protein
MPPLPSNWVRIITPVFNPITKCNAESPEAPGKVKNIKSTIKSTIKSNIEKASDRIGHVSQTYKKKMKKNCKDQCNTPSHTSMALYTSLNTSSCTTSTTNILKTSRTFQFHLAQGMGQRGHDLHAELVQQPVGGQRQQPHALVSAADGQERGLKAALRNRTHVHAPKNIVENKKSYPKS